MKFTHLMFIVLLTSWFSACVGASNTPATPSPLYSDPSVKIPDPSPTPACPVTNPQWLKPPKDSAVQGSPAYGHYFVNEDRSIWASAWWGLSDETPLQVSEDGVKVGWFRPTGAELMITGERMDAQAPPLKASVPCCYPTRFQASGLYFPTAGCWKVTARAEESELFFVVWVDP